MVIYEKYTLNSIKRMAYLKNIGNININIMNISVQTLALVALLILSLFNLSILELVLYIIFIFYIIKSIIRIIKNTFLKLSLNKAFKHL